MQYKTLVVLIVLVFASCTLPSGQNQYCRFSNCSKHKHHNNDRQIDHRYVSKIQDIRPQYAPQSKQKSQVAKQVKFSQLSFRKVSGGDGLLTGYVEGDGLARLKLNFLKDGEVETSRYIGSVMLHRGDPPTIFRFKTHLPDKYSYKWQVLHY